MMEESMVAIKKRLEAEKMNDHLAQYNKKSEKMHSMLNISEIELNEA